MASSVRSLYLTILLGVRTSIGDQAGAKFIRLQVLRAENTDSEAAYRALVALGNTVSIEFVM